MKALRNFSSRTGYDIHDALDRFPALILVEAGTLRERYRYLLAHLEPLTGKSDFEAAVNFYPKLLMKMPHRVLLNLANLDAVYKEELKQPLPWQVLHDERCAMLWLLPKGFVQLRASALVEAFGRDNAARLAGIQPLVMLLKVEHTHGVAGWLAENGCGREVEWRREHVDKAMEAYA